MSVIDAVSSSSLGAAAEFHALRRIWGMSPADATESRMGLLCGAGATGGFFNVFAGVAFLLFASLVARLFAFEEFRDVREDFEDLDARELVDLVDRREVFETRELADLTDRRELADLADRRESRESLDSYPDLYLCRLRLRFKDELVGR